MKKLFEIFHRFDRSQAKLARIQLAELSDWSLRDIGVLRQTSRLDAVKPFWMA
jgi:uncharacterized protein YjiS (DUF1127 family)